MTMKLGTISPGAFACVVIICILAYFFVTTAIMRNKPKRLWIPALLLLLFSTVFYSIAYWEGGACSPFSNLCLSLSAALDLFLFRMNSTYGRFTDMFYLQNGGDWNPDVTNRMILLCGLYLCSIWTTSIMVMHFFARRLVSKLILRRAWITRKNQGIHLFVGINPQTMPSTLPTTRATPATC